MTIRWIANDEDRKLIEDIAHRACESLGGYETLLDIVMDITACHLNGNPLDLNKFLNFEEFDFIHDVLGIRKNMNRNTGVLGNCFLPRCTLIVINQKLMSKA